MRAYFLLLQRVSALDGGFFCPLGYFWCSVVTSVTLSSKLSDLKKKIQKKQKIEKEKNPKTPKVLKKSEKKHFFLKKSKNLKTKLIFF